MTYEKVAQEFRERVKRRDHVLGNIPTLNGVIRTFEGYLREDDVEALLFDLCPEYSLLPENEQKEILAYAQKQRKTAS